MNRFTPGQKVTLVRHPGCTGTVVLADTFLSDYLVDVHPGAVENYGYICVLGFRGGVPWPLNWFKGDDLRPLEEAK